MCIQSIYIPWTVQPNHQFLYIFVVFVSHLRSSLLMGDIMGKEVPEAVCKYISQLLYVETNYHWLYFVGVNIKTFLSLGEISL